MSSYMLERLADLRFDAAAMLTSAPITSTVMATCRLRRRKRHIFDRQTASDLAVIGRDDALSRAMAENHGPARLVPISEHDAPIAAAATLPGTHNAQNIAAQRRCCRAMGLPDAAIAAA